MLVKAQNEQDKINLVLRSPQDIAFTLGVKRERQRNRQYRTIGAIEEIVFEVDRDCSLDTPQARITGRKLYWREDHPFLAITTPEEDLIFTSPLPLRDDYVYLPPIFDPLHEMANPLKVTRGGQSRLKEGERPRRRMIRQPIEKIASAKYRNFLVFHPVAQIIFLMNAGGSVGYASLGTARQPLTALPGRDGSKMALLIDPYTGEAFFTGGSRTFENVSRHGGEQNEMQAATADLHRSQQAGSRG